MKCNDFLYIGESATTLSVELYTEYMNSRLSTGSLFELLTVSEDADKDYTIQCNKTETPPYQFVNISSETKSVRINFVKVYARECE